MFVWDVCRQCVSQGRKALWSVSTLKQGEEAKVSPRASYAGFVDAQAPAQRELVAGGEPIVATTQITHLIAGL